MPLPDGRAVLRPHAEFGPNNHLEDALHFTTGCHSLVQEACGPFLLYSSVEISVFLSVHAILKRGSSSRWSSSLYCLRRNTDEMTFGKMHPTEEPERPTNENESYAQWIRLFLVQFAPHLCLSSFKSSRSIPFLAAYTEAAGSNQVNRHQITNLSEKECIESV